jgi:SAM-dependent methyltransferase
VKPISEDKREHIAHYEAAYSADHEFEPIMVAARQRAMLELIHRIRPRQVIEAGCGSELLYAKVDESGLPIEEWIIVEPADSFAHGARSFRGTNIRKRVLQAFIEDAVPEVQAMCAGGADMVIASGLLSDSIAGPTEVLGAVRQLLRPGGSLVVNVPNAYSFHRRLARAMGIILDEHAQSARNEALGQSRIFDMATLTACVIEAGFDIESTGGFFLKPFTHAQMHAARQLFTPAILDGLWRLGREIPEWASEIYVTAKVRG